MSNPSKLGEVQSRLGNELVKASTFRHKTNFPVGADPAVYRFFDDFNSYRSVATADTNDWLPNAATGGTADLSLLYADGSGGVLSIVLGAAANNVYQAWQTSAGTVDAAGAFALAEASDKKVWFETRFKCDVVGSGAAFLIGLAGGQAGEVLTDTTLLHEVDDGIFLMVDDDNATLDLKWCKDGEANETAQAIGTLTADTWHRAGFYFDGAKTVIAYLDGIAQVRKTVDTNFPDDELLTPVFATKTASAGHTLDIDFIDAAIER